MNKLQSRLTIIGPGTTPGRVLCRCRCGTEKEIPKRHVLHGQIISCGCAKTPERYGVSFRGVTSGPLANVYKCWKALRDRCSNPRNKKYQDYGGRGIDVCSRWADSFDAFYLDMGDRPDGLTLDRIDNDKGYWCGHPACPECGSFWREPNCRWATRKEQQRNTRRNRNITHDGRTQCLIDWANEIGVHYVVLIGRIERWGIERALTTPPKKYRPRGSRRA